MDIDPFTWIIHRFQGAVRSTTNTYFWRTYDQKEIDCIEERGGTLYGYEFKWQGEMKKSTRREFSEVYPDAELSTITRENFDEFLK